VEAPARAETGETVLVVDDQAMVRRPVTKTLEGLGYSALEVVDGPSGLKALQSDHRVDLPGPTSACRGLNGRQLADAARAVRLDLKLLFITGYAGNAAAGNGVLDPGREILPKPFAMDQLAGKRSSTHDGRNRAVGADPGSTSCGKAPRSGTGPASFLPSGVSTKP